MKKEYHKLEMKVVVLRTGSQLLAGSLGTHDVVSDNPSYAPQLNIE